MIGQLITNGYAYVASDGDVMYAVHKFAAYGKLSGKKLEDLRAGSRVEVDTAKRDPLDFVLWKSAKPGEPAWPSPWGDGRPGWHIECSAMSTKELGEHFDIHGGGLDLKFPHHENEIAQTCGATHGKFAEIWMHNGFLNIDNEKMSKSLGNFFTTREVLAKIKHPEVLRFFLLSSHYRGPMNYSPPQLDQSEAALTRMYLALRDMPVYGGDLHTSSAATGAFAAAMDDDFNTPEAIAVLQGLAREINTERTAKGESAKARQLASELRALGGVLGFLDEDPGKFLRSTATVTVGTDGAPALPGLSDAEIDALTAARNEARKTKNWAESDRIRDVLVAAGVILEDKPGGITVWRRK
jgi:cysteinyl-tRNA synthetase